MILKFEEFNESYLKGSRAPLYHYTDEIVRIMETDLLKTNTPSYPIDIKSISFTRDPYYTLDSISLKHDRIVVDTDKLIIDGYKPKPVDEIGMTGDDFNDYFTGVYAEPGTNFHKSNYKNYRNGNRTVNNRIYGMDKPNTKNGLEVEFEERIYKDIKNLGKYIISIDFSSKGEDVSRIEEMEFVNEHLGVILYEINEMIKKHPHIILNIYDTENRHKTIEITKEVKQMISVLSNEELENWI